MAAWALGAWFSGAWAGTVWAETTETPVQRGGGSQPRPSTRPRRIREEDELLLLIAQLCVMSIGTKNEA